MYLFFSAAQFTFVTVRVLSCFFTWFDIFNIETIMNVNNKSCSAFV